MQEGQGPVDLLGREVVADRAPRVASGLIPFGRPQVELLLSRRIPGPQFRAQRLPHEMVVAEAGPLIIERHQEQVGHVMLCSSAAASCRSVTAAHAPAVSSPRTDVSSMNRATSAGC